MDQKGSAPLILVGIVFVIVTIASVLYLISQGIITNPMTTKTTALPAATPAIQTNSSAVTSEASASNYQNPFTETAITDYSNPFVSADYSNPFDLLK